MQNPYMEDFAYANLCLRPKVCRYWKGMVISVNIQEAKNLLSYHSGRNSDVKNEKWEKGFLGSLRPFRGQLIEENFIEVMECLKVLKYELMQENIERDIMSDIIGIIYLARSWASPDGMLGRNKLLSQEQTNRINLWVDIIEECLMWLLESDEEDAFWSYKLYLEGEFEKELQGVN